MALTHVVMLICVMVLTCVMVSPDCQDTKDEVKRPGKSPRLSYITFSSAAIVACLVTTTSAAPSDCGKFEESKLCVSTLTNLLDRQPTEDEVVCQELCQSHTGCTHFTFVENKYPLETGELRLQCYLWKRCISKVTSFLHPNLTI